MDFVSITVEILKGLNSFVGSYGLAIILLTLIVRFAIWPLGASQQKSMRKMQELQPKIKELQLRYQSDPQTMQKKMMEFYKEHKFNPFAGCLPLLLQMPIFIVLYAALSSPQFKEAAGMQSFFFINNLSTTMQSHTGVDGDKVFGVNEKDTFSAEKVVKVYTNKGEIKQVELKDPGKAVAVQGVINPGKPVDLVVNPYDIKDLSIDELKNVKQAEVAVINNSTKEIERLKFDKQDSMLVSNVKTNQVKTVFHWDVFALVVLFAATMLLSQKVMTSSSKNASLDPTQKAMQDQMTKMMPIMFTVMFFFIPIPAGVLLYMIVSNVFQIAQTAVVNKQIDLEDQKKTSINKVPSDSQEVIIDAEAINDPSKKKRDKKNKW